MAPKADLNCKLRLYIIRSLLQMKVTNEDEHKSYSAENVLKGLFLQEIRKLMFKPIKDCVMFLKLLWATLLL